MLFIKKILSVLILFFAVSFSAVPLVLAERVTDQENYQLSITFDLEENLITGTTKITIRPGHNLSLSIARLTLTGIMLKDGTGREKNILPVNDMITIPASEISRELYISYTRKISNSSGNIISPDGICLVSNWHPVPDVPMVFKLTASLPDGFMAVTEADHFPLPKKGDAVTATFSQPIQTLHFIAGPYVHNKRKVREGLFVHSLFFIEEQHLANDYLQSAVRFLNRYEKEIGPYPYNHYVIAANRLPTGFAMPGFTLIGQMVLRLPFIKETSLGHEILHSWFGNNVGVDYADGNWCEGLTSYLADHSYRAEKGEGLQDRKEAILNYLSYVHEDTVIPLREFKSTSHNQRFAKARRAVGYTRSALLFHELKEKIGEQSFKDAIRLFYTDNSGNEATWSDLQKSFEISSGRKLDSFFQERLEMLEIPSLKVKEIEVTFQEGKPVLSFTLLQQTESPFTLVIPISIKGVDTTTTHNQFINEKETRISMVLASRPLEFTIDPEYSFLRELHQPEMTAVLARFMGAEDRLVILASEKERAFYSSFLKALEKNDLTVKLSGNVTNQELSENSLLFLGMDQNAARSLFGAPNHKKEGFTLDVRTNPLNSEHVAVLVSSSSKAETDAIAGRITHYGKYSFLHFLHGRNLEKKISSTQSGIHIVLEELPDGGKTSSIASFNQVIDELSNSRVIYIGETHTSLSDHLLQLRIIQALYAKDPDLAIGMEMFPSTVQSALDRYVLGEENLDERTFLKESEYFKVWRYDYRFFRDIINFARTNKIPVRGLNLDKEIVSTVFRTGNTDSLEETTLKSLPAERDLDLPGYRERLSMMHTIHMEGSHGSGKISGFIQAQGLWDETMADNIVTYLKENPNRRMIVLAGAQHSRKDSGIPPRVKRKLDIEQSSVLNIYNSYSPSNLAQVADYYFLAGASDLPETPKIGIVLTTVEDDNQAYLKISQISPHGKAGEAGLLEGDILKTINGFQVKEMADLRIAMMDAKEGETIVIKVLRNDGNTQMEKAFQVELSSSPPPMMHP